MRNALLRSAIFGGIVAVIQFHRRCILTGRIFASVLNLSNLAGTENDIEWTKNIFQTCHVSRISRETHALSVNSRISAR